MKSLLRHRILMLLAGIVTAGIIVFSQLFYFQAATYCQEKATTEQQSQKKADAPKTYISIPSSTISFAPHIEISQDLSFVLETLFELDSEQESSATIALPVNKFFETLFRVIISPNAP